METEREATKKSWAEQMDEEEEGEKPLTVKKRPRPEEIPDHPADVGIIEEQGIRFPRVSMDDIEIVDGVMKEPVSQSPNKQSRNARIEAGVLRSIQKCTTGKALQDLAKTIHPEDITVPILNAFLKVMQPLLQCPSCEGIGTQHHWKPFGHQNQAQCSTVLHPGSTSPQDCPGRIPVSSFWAFCLDLPTLRLPNHTHKMVHSLFTPPVMDTIPKPPSSLQECKKTVRDPQEADARDPEVLHPRESHSEVVTQLCGKLAKENLIMRKREQAGGSRPEPGSYLNAAKRNGAKKPSPTLQAIAAIAKLAPALQQEQLDKLAETRRNPVTNSPLRQREPAIKRTPLNIQSVDDITNPILKSKVNSMKWTVLENLPGENRTHRQQRMMGNKTEIAFHGEDAQKAIDNLVMRVSRVKTVAIDIRTTYFEGDGKEEMKDRFMNNLAQDMVQAHDMAFIIASNNGKPTTIRVGSLNVRGLTNSYHECIDLLHKSGLTRRGISIMRNPATTSAEDFTLIEKDPEGDFIWFRFKGVIRIGVFYIPPNLKRSRHYRKKLVSIRRMHHMFPAEPSMILGDFNTRLGNPHNGDLRGYKEKCAEIREGTLLAITNALEGANMDNLSDKAALEVVDKAMAALTTPLAKVLAEVVGRRNPNKSPKADSCWDDEMKSLAKERQSALHRRNDTYTWSPLYAQAEEEREGSEEAETYLSKEENCGIPEMDGDLAQLNTNRDRQESCSCLSPKRPSHHSIGPPQR
ncbi:hypothetical protein BC829DRAFT_422344 [Chytridium lagenaria]|nr:hypothetical protein BC829DRAFT_422344 [Chytridium lagenaria]